MQRFCRILMVFLLACAACGGPSQITFPNPPSGDEGEPPPDDAGGDKDTGEEDPVSGGSSSDMETCPARGFNFVCWYRGCFQEETVGESLEAAKNVGANWLAIVPTWYQDSLTSNHIFEHASRSPNAADLTSVINEAHALGFQILLKPHIDILGGGWRGNILPDNLSAWQEDYRSFLLTMADQAETLNVEALAVGTELKKQSDETAFWRNLIGDIRERYSGLLTYASNWDEYDAVAFWGDLDFVGTDFYFPLTDDPDATEEEMEASLSDIGETLAAFSETAGKKFLITEIGYRSVNGTNTRPYDYDMAGATDPGEQANAYGAVLNTYGGAEWLEGIFWWRWDIELEDASDEGYLIYGKPAADVLASYWEDDVCE